MAKVSMQQIADELGVSKSLVSLALTNSYGVKEDTRFKIYLTALKMGYDFKKVNNQNEHKIKDKYSILVFIKQNDLVTERFWPEILSGIEIELSNANYRMKTKVWDDDSTSDELLVDIATSNADGVIIISEFPKESFFALKAMNIPVVVVDSKEYVDGMFDVVRSNNFLGGYLAAEYLINNNHKNVCFVGDIELAVSFKERFNGFSNYLSNAKDIKINNVITSGRKFSDVEYLYNRKDFINLLKSNNMPTAVFCQNDPTAEFVYEDIKSLGINIPNDISVIGYDNILLTNAFVPALTSVNVCKREIGKEAVCLLISRIKNPKKLNQSVQISVNIDEKKSVKKK